MTSAICVFRVNDLEIDFHVIYRRQSFFPSIGTTTDIIKRIVARKMPRETEASRNQTESEIIIEHAWRCREAHTRNCIIRWNCSHARKANGPVRMHLSFSPFLSPGGTFGRGMRIGACSLMHFIRRRGEDVPRELSRRSGNLNRSAQKSASITCGKSPGFRAPELRECLSASGESCESREARCIDERTMHFDDSLMSIKSVYSRRKCRTKGHRL